MTMGIYNLADRWDFVSKAHLPRINLKPSPVNITRHNVQQIIRFYFASKESETK